jgi:predicted RNA binding protein YcfA (HicA-like mRNA interferase family)
MRLGWEFKHHTGSHMILDKPGQEYTLSIPDHPELRPGLLRALIRMAGLTVDEFIAAIKT